MNNDIESMTRIVFEVLAVTVDDGVEFEPAGSRSDVIRDADPYTGVRITVPARVDRARHPLRVDVDVGDPVTPSPVEIPYPALLGEPFSLVGYPLETVLAEKLVTMVDRGDATSRERDFADVYALTSRHAVDAVSLSAAVRATGAHRGSDLRPLAEVVVDLANLRQVDWQRFVARAGLAGEVPASYAEAIEAISAFADPILSGNLTEGRWDPRRRRWRRRR